MDRVIFASKYANEIRRLSFDFGSFLAVGETVSSASVSAAVYLGDEDGELTFDGPEINGSVVTVYCSGGENGTTFVVTMLGISSEGQRLPLSGYLAVVPV